MGSLALQKGNNEEAETYLRRAADAPRPVVLAQNDLAEVLRRTKRLEEAERYARLAVKTAPELYVAWETLGSILMDSNGDLNEAEQCVNRACELSKSADGKEEDVRMLVSLARVQVAKGDKQRANMTIRKVQGRIKELSDFEKGEFEELKKSAK
jgi:Flp pilus assembly protein TadD